MSNLVVYDCMLFFRAVSRPNRVNSLFDLVAQRKVSLCLSADVLTEIRDVLTRPKLVLKYPALSLIAVDAFLAQIVREAKWCNYVPERYFLVRDPKDSKYINLALAAPAKHLVTTDRDLLDLMDAQSQIGQEFMSQFPDLRIVQPAEFLQTIAANLAES